MEPLSSIFVIKNNELHRFACAHMGIMRAILGSLENQPTTMLLGSIKIDHSLTIYLQPKSLGYTHVSVERVNHERLRDSPAAVCLTRSSVLVGRSE